MSGFEAENLLNSLHVHTRMHTYAET